VALILCMETATEMCSVALFRDETLLGIKESAARNVHSAMLTTFIDELVTSSGIHFNDLDAVAVSMGPGSYTGLRIGVATAKGLCYALGRPLIAVPTLEAMAGGIRDALRVTRDSAVEALPELYCPMIDARRMEVFCALYDMDGKEVRGVQADIIDEYSFQEFLADHTVIFGGEGAEKCRAALGSHPNAVFMEGFRASANTMTGIAAARFRESRFENLAYFEPYYLKDFVAGKPRVKGLH
jgi:tRNA threonylcarbamoyladenosine biosynthesis protein TsaB